MMAGVGVVKARPVVDRALFFILGAVIKPANAGKRYRRCAHCTGLKRDMKIAIGEPFVRQYARCFADNQNFRMGGRIGR